MVVRSNEYVADALLISLHGKNIGDYYKQDIVSNISFEALLPSIKKLLLSANDEFCE